MDRSFSTFRSSKSTVEYVGFAITAMFLTATATMGLYVVGSYAVAGWFGLVTGLMRFSARDALWTQGATFIGSVSAMWLIFPTLLSLGFIAGSIVAIVQAAPTIPLFWLLFWIGRCAIARVRTSPDLVR